MPLSSAIRKVLLIDDDEDDFSFFREAIQIIDPTIEVNYISSVNDLPKDGSCNVPDLLFLDINMPDKNGFEWLRDIRSSGYTLPVIMYSTASNMTYVEKAYTQGATIYFPKPESFATLQKSLKYLLSLNWEHPAEVQKLYCKDGAFKVFQVA